MWPMSKFPIIDQVSQRMITVIIVVYILYTTSLPLTGYDLQHWRIPGVLQRFGVSYFVVAMTELFCTHLYPKFNVSGST